MYAGRDVFEAGILMALEWTRNDRRRGLGMSSEPLPMCAIQSELAGGFRGHWREL